MPQPQVFNSITVAQVHNHDRRPAPTCSPTKASLAVQGAMLVVAILSLALPPLTHGLVPSQGIVFVAAIYVCAIIVYCIDVVRNFRSACFANTPKYCDRQDLIYCILDVLTMAIMGLEVFVWLHPTLARQIVVIISKVAMVLKTAVSM